MHESILEAIHATAQGLHQNGVMKRETLREFDALCIPPVKEIQQATDPESRHSLQDVLTHAPGHLAFQSVDEIDAHIRAERDTWDD